MKPMKDLPNFAEEIRALLEAKDSFPPIHMWEPEHLGQIAINIDVDGQWFFQGDPMERESVPRLLSRILLKEGDDYFLVSPVEKLRISVDDAPFVVRLLDVEGEGQKQRLHFSTNMGDNFTLDTDHPLRVEYNEKGEPRPYVRVRDALEARISRSVYYELADLAQPGGSEDEFGVWSAGQFHKL